MTRVYFVRHAQSDFHSGSDEFWRIIDWMPFVIEPDYERTRYLGRREHVHIKKIYAP